MTNIVIKDLNESREMDREAMRAVTGGRANSSYVPDSPYCSSLAQDDHQQKLFSWVTAGSRNN